VRLQGACGSQADGKRAVCRLLILHRCATPPQMPRLHVDTSGWVASKASLSFLPSAVLKQWLARTECMLRILAELTCRADFAEKH
jgi:hypothetical protein